MEQEKRTPGQPPGEKRRLENAAFQAWLEVNQFQSSVSATADVERLVNEGAARYVRDEAPQRIIASPREYQVELFERAKLENSIVVLDTGSGKTLVAALLLRHILEQEVQDRHDGLPPKVAFFLVDKVALCHQQHAVLSTNLDYPIDRLHGDMPGMLKTKAFWDQKFETYMAFVCTAQILLDVLEFGFISMNQINLLVFDEAHHTKKNHPYARIVKEHYKVETQQRPRILGMTASPVEGNAKDIKKTIEELEAMLQSKIATVAKETAFRDQLAKGQHEFIEFYKPNWDIEVTLTKLWYSLSMCLGENPRFKTHLDYTRSASSELGPWVCDRYWKLLMTDTEVLKFQAKTEADLSLSTVDISDAAVAAIHIAKRFVDEHHLLDVEWSWDQISPKITSLRSILKEAFISKGSRRCIVFVKERATAFMLNDLFKQPDVKIKEMNSSYLVSSHNMPGGIANMSYRDIIVTLRKFRDGELNCLFATSVAEEGIDIPDCDHVIRFDIFDSMIQYLQSKGRARRHQSYYRTMLEEENLDHLKKFHQITSNAHLLHSFCNALPESRRIGDFAMDPYSLSKIPNVPERNFHITETGVQINFLNSVATLSRFMASLPSETNYMQRLEYVVMPTPKREFIATIVFPPSSPIRVVTGRSQRSKQLARCSAAFEACIELVREHHFDKHLQPTFIQDIPQLRAARLAIPECRREKYEMYIKPEFWSQHIESSPPTKLFPTMIALDTPEALGRPVRPLILLTRAPLPVIPSIPLFFANGKSSSLKPKPSLSSIAIDKKQAEALTAFTLVVFNDAFSKEYEATSAEIPYFLAPHDIVNGSGSRYECLIDWILVDFVSQNPQLQWNSHPSELFINKLVIDPHDGSRKFILNSINHNLKPTDPVPDGAPPPKGLAYRKSEHNILQYSISLSIKSRQRIQWDETQPVYNAELLSTRRNFLHEFVDIKDDHGNCCIILQPMRISPLPVDIAHMSLLFPVIMHRIDSVLIALDACALKGLPDINSSLALEALTKDSFNADENGLDQVGFQAGMGKNYERLEFLGDTFLKMATTIAVFTQTPQGSEFTYHVTRMVMINNNNLFLKSYETLSPYIRTQPFNRRTWYPNMPLKKGKPTVTQAFHNVSHKSIADVAEALIGAAYMSGDGNMDMAVEAVTAMVKNQNHEMAKFSDYYASYQIPEWQSQTSSAVQLRDINELETITGYRFRSGPLLRSAFKHSSYTYEPMPTLERLEFLGDALLDMAIVDYLFRKHPGADPSWLTSHKIAMISNHFQGCLCVKMGLHKHILLTTGSILEDIYHFVNQLELTEKMALVQAEEKAALPLEEQMDALALECRAEAAKVPKDFWTTAPQPPKVLADVLEALVGAMFVDSQYDFGVVQRFFQRHIQPYFEDITLYDNYANNYAVTVLGEKLQGEFRCSGWALHVATVPPPVEDGIAAITEVDVLCALSIHQKVCLHAKAMNASEAKKEVARMALEKFSDYTADEFKEEMGCGCGGLKAEKS